MCLYLNPEEKVLTIDKVERRAAKFQRLYKKRLRGQPGRRPNKALFLLMAAYSIFKEEYPQGKEYVGKVSDWLDDNFSQYDPDGKGDCFHLKNLHKCRTSRPFKEMQYQEAWDDIKTSYEISCNGASKGEMTPRDIMRKYSISKRKLEDFAGFILSQHTGNKKTFNKKTLKINKFIFDRPA